MASSLRVNAIVPASGTNVAIGTAGGTITYAANVSGVSTFSNGIIVSAGSTSAPSISPVGDSNTGIFFPSADTVCIGEGGAEVIRVDSSGRVGVGTTNPTATLDVFTAGTSNYVRSRTNSASDYSIFALQNNGASGREYHLGLGGNSAGNSSLQNSFYVWDNTAGASRLVIDSSGRVTIPYQPAFYAYNSTGNNITNGNIIDFTVTLVNIGSYYSTSTSRFTAPVSGTYYFYAQLLSEDSTVATDFRFNLNGVSRNGGYSGSGTWTSGNGYKTATGATIMTVSAGDIIDVRSVGTSTIHTDGSHTYFFGYLIG